MNRYTGHKYCVIKFWKLPFKGIDEFVCIPSSWILRRATDKKVLVAYPVEHTKHTERRVKQRQRLSEDWRGYVADVKYGTDSYVDAQNFIKKQNEYKCPNAEKNGGPELSGKKKAQESKREHKLNYKMAVPEEFVVLKNDEFATKIRLKRLALSKARKSVKTQSNVATLGSIESTESDSEVEFSSSEASESSSKNQLSSLYEEFMIENFNKNNRVEEITNFERNTNKTPCGIQNLSNLANQSLDSITINKKKFLTGFFKFLRENPEKTKEALKFRTSKNNILTASTSKDTTADVTKISGRTRNVEKEQNIDDVGNDEDTSKDTTAEVTKISGSTRNVEKDQNIDNDDDDGNDEDTSKYTTAEVTKISGSTRNVEKEQYNDDDDEEDQVLNKNRCHEQKFILPPEYDENNSRWTLKYYKSAPELVELMPHTGVYVNAVKLSTCMRLAKDCNTLARNLMPEIFKTSALSTCSLTGKKARGYDIFGVRPGLNKQARTVLIAFVKQYGLKKGSQTNTQSILNNIRNKLRDMRRKQK